MAFPSNTPAAADPAGRLQEAIQLFVQSGPRSETSAGTRLRALAAGLKQLLPPGMERHFLADAAVQQAADGDAVRMCVLIETPGVDALLEQYALQWNLHRMVMFDADLFLLPALFSQPAGQWFLLSQPKLLSRAAYMVAKFDNFRNVPHPVLEDIFGARGVGAGTGNDELEPATAAAAASFIAEQPVLSRAVVAAAVRSLGRDEVDGNNIIPAVARLLPVREALLASEVPDEEDPREPLGLLDRLLSHCGWPCEGEKTWTLCKTLLGSTDQPLTEELVAAVTRRLDFNTCGVADGARLALAHLAPGST